MSIEEFLGARLFAVAGAIVILVGAALGIGLAVQAGLWGAMPPAARAGLIAAFGVALIVAGEIVLRRVGRPAAIGLFAAGIGVLWLDAFAAWRAFGVVDETGALVLMGAVSAVAFGLTWRSGSAVVGHIALVAGFLSPALVVGRAGGDFQIPIAVTALLGLGLALSALVPRPFRALRATAVVGGIVVGGGWVAIRGPAMIAPSLVFASGWWAMVAAEASYAAVRRQSRHGNVIAMLSATAAVSAAILVTLTPLAGGGTELRGLFLLAIGVGSIVLAMQFGTGLDGLRQRPDRAIGSLTVVHWLSAGGLIVASIGIQISGAGTTIGWLALGLAAVEMGRRLPSLGVLGYGLTVLVLGLIRIVVFDRVDPALDTTVVAAAGVEVRGWTLLAFGGVASMLAAGWRWPAAMGPVGHALLALGVLSALAVEATATSGTTRPAALVLTAIAAIEIARRTRGLPLAMSAIAGTVVAIPLIAVEPIVPEAAGVIGLRLGPWLLVAGLVAVAWVHHAIRLPGVSAPWRAAIALGGWMLLGVAGTAGAPGAGVALGWAIAAAGLAFLSGSTWPRGRFELAVAVAMVGAAGVAASAISGARFDQVPFAIAAAAVGGVVVASVLARWRFASASVVTNSGDESASRRALEVVTEASWWLVAALAAALAAILVGRLDPARSWIGIGIPDEGWAGLGGLLVILVVASIAVHLPSASIPRRVSSGLLTVGTALWMAFALGDRFWGQEISETIIGSTRGLTGLSLIIIGAVLALLPARDARDGDGFVRAAAAGAAIAALFLWGSLEVEVVFQGDRSRVLAGLSGWWGAIGISLVVLGFMVRSAVARRAGLALLVLTTVKVLVIDLAGADDLARVVSFVVCGLLLVAASVVYNRLSRRLEPASSDSDGSD